MAISATLQISEPNASGMAAAFSKTFLDVYTVLKLDYVIERTCDKTGRPSGKASISVIKVTIRAAKESKAVFHKWIADADALKDGEIKIFDSSGILSSSIQDATGIDPLLDSEEVTDLLSDMAGGAMGTAMDDASDYDTRDLDLYDETPHKDLVAKAKERGIVITDKDTDDDIRDMLRTWDDLNTKKADGDTKTKFEEIDDSVDKKSLSELKAAAKDYDIPEPEDETKNMTLEQLKQYAKENGLNVKENATEDDYKTAVKEDMEKKYYRVEVKKFQKAKMAKEKKQASNLADQSYAPAYQKADALKKRTVTSLKGAGQAAVKRNFECARCITFTNAYCISLRELFSADSKDQNELNSSYPWTLEIGIKPKEVTVTGEQLASNVFDSDPPKFTLY